MSTITTSSAGCPIGKYLRKPIPKECENDVHLQPWYPEPTHLSIPPEPASNRLKLKPEEMIAHRAALFLQRHYPTVIYRFDVAADLATGRNAKRTFGVVKAKYNHVQGYPDLFIAHPIQVQGRMIAGLFLEIKTDESKVFTKKGKIKSGAHLARQAYVLRTLHLRGYSAEFAWGENNQIFNFIAEYLNCDYSIRR